MTWYWLPVDEWQSVEVYDHSGSMVLTVDNPDAPERSLDDQGVPVAPDVRRALVDHLVDRGQADIYAMLAVAEALTGAAFERGQP